MIFTLSADAIWRKKMIYRTLEQIETSPYNVDWGNGRSRRFLLEKDQLGFTLTDTVVDANSETSLQYDHHVEACYCISGTGEVETAGRVYPLAPGVMYAFNKHESHVVRAKTALRLVCVFRPALSGFESHKGADSEASGY